MPSSQSRSALPIVPASELEAALAAALDGEVRFDAYTRHLFSTDASMYAIEPLGVAFPRDANDVVAAVEVAAAFGVPVLPRGGGTSLGGQTVGQAVVLDFSRHMHAVLALDPEAKTARVQPGLVQDDLNREAGEYGLWFAPDTSTSSRATLGGMIGNNSCGARSARYGMTVDHVEALEVVLSDASRARLGAMDSAEVERRAKAQTVEGRLYREIPALVAAHGEAIRSGFPSHWRKTGGYRLERMLPETGSFDLSKLVVGSEGTLAVTVEATVRLVPRPSAVAALAGHFESVDAALEAVADARAAGAAAIELVDELILGLARRSPLHGHLANALVGEPAALLWVEFYGDTPLEATAAAATLEATWRRKGHAYAVARADSPALVGRYRELRKAGLGLLMAAGTGGERSLAFIEDTAVDPDRLPQYTRDLSGILERHGLRAGFYGHASAGCLHIRPFMDLRREGDVPRMRAVAEEVSELVSRYDGMNSSEHGDGLVRAEFSRRLFGEELYEAMRAVKGVFDPESRLNPGKKVDPPLMDENLRDPALPMASPLETWFSFGAEGMASEANRCVRVGACRRSPHTGGTMCPSYMATRSEEHSTRGRANALVKALSSPDPGGALGEERLQEILDLCLECKACKLECPMSVDMAKLKAETLAWSHALHGAPLSALFFGRAREMNRVGSALAPLSNWLVTLSPARVLAERLLDLDRRRPLPRFRRDTLQRWFARRARGRARRTNGDRSSRGALVFLADSFTSYSEPDIGRAAIELLEQAGWEVRLAGDVCCGRALISKGLLSQAQSRHEELIRSLGPAAAEGIPIVGCEPSCVFALKDELPALARDKEGASTVALQTRWVDELLVEAIDDGSLVLDAEAEVSGRPILLHPHCHQKAAAATGSTVALLERIPGAQLTVLDAGCCGMAGSFGFERAHYDLSLAIGGQRLFPAVSAAAADTLIAAPGVSCRQQIAHGTRRTARHPVVLVRAALGGS